MNRRLNRTAAADPSRLIHENSPTTEKQLLGGGGRRGDREKQCSEGQPEQTVCCRCWQTRLRLQSQSREAFLNSLTAVPDPTSCPATGVDAILIRWLLSNDSLRMAGCWMAPSLRSLFAPQANFRSESNATLSTCGRSSERRINGSCVHYPCARRNFMPNAFVPYSGDSAWMRRLVVRAELSSLYLSSCNLMRP